MRKTLVLLACLLLTGCVKKADEPSDSAAARQRDYAMLAREDARKATPVPLPSDDGGDVAVELADHDSRLSDAETKIQELEGRILTLEGKLQNRDP